MTIWIIAILLVGLMAVSGYYLGAIRSALGVLGLLVGLLVALPLSPAIKPLVPLVGLKNPIWSWILPPLAILILVEIVFLIGAYFAHRKLDLRFKYHADDVQYLFWQRLNQRLGIPLGIVSGLVYLLLIAMIINAAGYLTVQTSAGDSDPALVRLLNSARADLHKTGLDKIVAAFDPIPENFYTASDIIGLVYHNPALHGRLSSYPALLSLGERPEFQDIAVDTEYLQLWQTRASLAALVNHPKTQTILGSLEIRQEVQQVDLQDLCEYLETGKSLKYEEEKILGRWKIDLAAILIEERKRRPDISAAQMKLFRKILTNSLVNVSLLAMPDSRAILKLQINEPPPAAPNPPEEQAAAETATATPGMDPELAKRYGLRPSPLTAETPAPAPAAESPRQTLIASGQGSWERDGSRYRIKLQDEKGAEHTSLARVDGDKLYVLEAGRTFVFVRAD